MSTEAPPEGNFLFDWYQRYIGEPNTKTDVYVGFALFFGGIAFGGIGIVLFLMSAQFEAGTELFWAIRQVSVILAALGLPALMLGIVVLLPVGKRAIAIAAGGIFICVVALGIFAAMYPSNWNVQHSADYSAHGVAIYSAGLAIVMASTAAALVGHHLDRARPVIGEGVTADDGEKPETVSDEQVRLDIEESLRDVEYSWGGLRKVNTRRLEVDIDDGGIDSSGFTNHTGNTTRRQSSDVEHAVSGLKQLRGGDVDEATGSGTDSQSNALAELRREQEAERLATKESGKFGQVVSKLTGILPKK